jgi:hypothetical protein
MADQVKRVKFNSQEATIVATKPTLVVSFDLVPAMADRIMSFTASLLDQNDGELLSLAQAITVAPLAEDVARVPVAFSDVIFYMPGQPLTGHVVFRSTSTAEPTVTSLLGQGFYLRTAQAGNLQTVTFSISAGLSADSDGSLVAVTFTYDGDTQFTFNLQLALKPVLTGIAPRVLRFDPSDRASACLPYTATFDTVPARVPLQLAVASVVAVTSGAPHQGSDPLSYSGCFFCNGCRESKDIALDILPAFAPAGLTRVHAVPTLELSRGGSPFPVLCVVGGALATAIILAGLVAYCWKRRLISRQAAAERDAAASYAALN